MAKYVINGKSHKINLTDYKWTMNSDYDGYMTIFPEEIDIPNLFKYDKDLQNEDIPNDVTLTYEFKEDDTLGLNPILKSFEYAKGFNFKNNQVELTEEEFNFFQEFLTKEIGDSH